MIVTFAIEGEAVAKERPRTAIRRTRKGKLVPHIYTPSKTMRAQRDVAGAAIEAGVRKTSGPVHVRLEYVFERPKRSRSDYPIRDVDNLAKTTLDGLNGIAWDDDVQVISLVVHKRWCAAGEKSHTKVMIMQEVAS